MITVASSHIFKAIKIGLGGCIRREKSISGVIAPQISNFGGLIN
jgi:hypothetical protein